MLRLKLKTCRLLLLAVILCSLTTRVTAQSDLPDRIAAVTQQIQANQGNPELWFQRADLHRQRKEYDDALTDLDQADLLKSAWPATDLLRAQIFFDQENYSKARRAASACLKLDPANAGAHIIRARSLIQLEKFSAAVEDYDAAIASPGTDTQFLTDLYVERALAQGRLDRLDDAIRGLDDATKRLGEKAAFAMPAIEFERQRGAFEAALARLEQAQKYFSYEMFLTTRGEILFQAGRQTEAKADFDAALASLESLQPAQRAAPANSDLATRLRADLKQITRSSAR